MGARVPGTPNVYATLGLLEYGVPVFPGHQTLRYFGPTRVWGARVPGTPNVYATLGLLEYGVPVFPGHQTLRYFANGFIRRSTASH